MTDMDPTAAHEHPPADRLADATDGLIVAYRQGASWGVVVESAEEAEAALRAYRRAVEPAPADAGALDRPPPTMAALRAGLRVLLLCSASYPDDAPAEVLAGLVVDLATKLRPEARVDAYRQMAVAQAARLDAIALILNKPAPTLAKIAREVTASGRQVPANPGRRRP